MESQSLIVLLDEEHSGRDEMNLAGNPFALLQAASKTGVSRIENTWTRILPGGKSVEASWVVEGDSHLGLPGPNEELLYLVLLQLTREAKGDSAEWPREVFFSRYELLGRLKWNKGMRGYAELSNAFTRLQSVRVTAKNSFYNAQTGAPFAQIGFAILDEYKIVEESAGVKSGVHIPLSSFKWSDTLHESLQAGNVRSFALDFALSLELPTSVRLFRLLELFRHSGSHSSRRWEIGVFKLRDRLGMKDYAFTSKVKEKLAPAIEELKARGYLADVDYRKGADKQEIAVFRFGDPRVFVEALAPAATTPEMIDLKSKAEPTNETPQERALRGFEKWKTLDEPTRETLRQKAREGVVRDFWDRLEVPESPMSMKLWELVLAL